MTAPADPLASFVPQAAPPLSDHYYARLFTPRERRTAVTAVLGYAAELRACARTLGDHGVAHVKLGWWEEEIALLASGAPRHPLAVALVQVAELRSAGAPLHALLTAARRDLARAPCPTLEALRARCAEAGALHELLARALSADGSACTRARTLGAAAEFAAAVAGARRDAAAGRLLLPTQMFADAGLELSMLQQEPWPERALAIQRELGARAGGELDAARAGIEPRLRPALQSALVLAALQRARLDALDRARGEVAPLLRLWTAWRTARYCAQTE